LILLRNPKWGPILWLAYYIPRLSRASLCVSWAFLLSFQPSSIFCRWVYWSKAVKCTTAYF